MFGVQFITHHTDTITYLDSVRIALEGGCRWIQLRMKEAPDTQAEEVARQALALCRAAGAVFIIDDRVELAGRLHADGVHLGKADMPVREARRLLGPGFRIGGTANTFEDVRIHYEGGADYIGCGPFRYTTTKQKLAPILGLEGYRAITARMREEGIDPALLEEATSMGAAVTGGVGVGVFKDFTAIDQMLEIRQTIEPDPAAMAAYQPVKETFELCYQSLLPVYEHMAAQK